MAKMLPAGQQALSLAAPLRAETVTAICEHGPVLRIVSRCWMIMTKGQEQKIGGDQTMDGMIEYVQYVLDTA